MAESGATGERWTAGTPPHHRRGRLLRVLTALGIVWGQAVLVLAYQHEPTPRSLTLMFAIQCSGLYTVFLYVTRGTWLSWAKRQPIRNATILGIINAAIVETVFLVFEKLLGAEKVAAHPNLIMDLILTWPWYMGMVWIFVRVQARQQFRPALVLLLGGLYECGSDGIIGGVLAPLIGGAMPNLLIHILQLFGLGLWMFIPVYSSMVLPAVWILDELPQPTSRPRAWRDALRPLLWLFPFALYLGVVILIMGVVKNFL